MLNNYEHIDVKFITYEYVSKYTIHMKLKHIFIIIIFVLYTLQKKKSKF